MLMGEYKLPNMTKAEMVLELMYKMEDDEDKDYPLSYYIDAARDYSSMEDAERGLIKQCPICYETRPVHEVIFLGPCDYSGAPKSRTSVVLYSSIYKIYEFVGLILHG